MWINSLFHSLFFFFKLRLLLFFSRPGRVMHKQIQKWLLAKQKSCICKEYKIPTLFILNWKSTLVYSPLLLINSPSWHSKIKQMLLSTVCHCLLQCWSLWWYITGWNQNNEAFTDLFHIVLVFKKKPHYAFLKWFCNSCLPFFHRK